MILMEIFIVSTFFLLIFLLVASSIGVKKGSRKNKHL